MDRDTDGSFCTVTAIYFQSSVFGTKWYRVVCCLHCYHTALCATHPQHWVNPIVVCLTSSGQISRRVVLISSQAAQLKAVNLSVWDLLPVPWGGSPWPPGILPLIKSNTRHISTLLRLLFELQTSWHLKDTLEVCVTLWNNERTALGATCHAYHLYSTTLGWNASTAWVCVENKGFLEYSQNSLSQSTRIWYSTSHTAKWSNLEPSPTTKPHTAFAYLSFPSSWKCSQ